MNLERSAPNSLTRPGKIQDGLGAARLPGRDGVGAGGAGGFLSVLAGLESAPPAGPLDLGTASPGLLGSVDNTLIVPPAEPQLPDTSRLVPDAGWQLDTAALLAHLNRSSQCLPSAAGAAAPSSTVAGRFGQAGLSSQPTPTAMPPVAVPALVAAPTNGVEAGVDVLPANRQPGLPGQVAPEGAIPLAASPPTAGPDGMGAAPQGLPAAPVEQAQPQPAPLPASELDVTRLQAMLAQSATRETVAGSATVLPADLAKPGALRLPPEPLGPAQPTMPVDLRGSESPRVPLDAPQTLASRAVVPNPMTGTRGPTQAPVPQSEAAPVSSESVAVGSPGLPLAATNTTGPTLTPHAEPARSMPSQATHDTKVMQNVVESDLAAPGTVGWSGAIPAGASEGISRSADRAVAKSVEPHRGAGGEGLWGPVGLVSGKPVEAALAAQNAALPTPEMMVAEQVSYWIAGKVQNAELRLDVFGRQPVEVSISMNGSEAQVEFRTDQPEVRQVLEGAVAHLRDLLKDEGLSLGGVFVGSSGQQRQGGQGSASPASDASLRQARVEVAQTTASSKPAHGHPTAGRSVDLFV